MTGTSTEARIIYVTTNNEIDAVKIGRSLLEEGLIACANVLPQMRSIYKWKGQVQNENEAVLILKSIDTKIAALKSRIVELHPYECPCLLVLPVTDGHPAYLDWLSSQIN